MVVPNLPLKGPMIPFEPSESCHAPGCFRKKPVTQGKRYCSDNCRLVANIVAGTSLNLSTLRYNPQVVAIRLMEATTPGFLASIEKAHSTATVLHQWLYGVRSHLIGHSPLTNDSEEGDGI